MIGGKERDDRNKLSVSVHSGTDTYDSLDSVDRQPPFSGIFISPLIVSWCMLRVRIAIVEAYQYRHADLSLLVSGVIHCESVLPGFYLVTDEARTVWMPHLRIKDHSGWE